MRLVFAATLFVLAGHLFPQGSWMPLSREVERPYALLVEAAGSTVHTAIRPYRQKELRALVASDTLLPESAIAALDRWAGARNGRKARWGPLLDLHAGAGIDTAQAAIHRIGAGLWYDQDLGERWSVHASGMAWNERLPAYLDSFAIATQLVPGEGIAYAPLAGDARTYSHYDWNAWVSWDPGKRVNLTLGRGRNFFGDGHRSLMLSDEATSYPHLKVTTSIWKLKYVNLFAAMNDIRGADGDPSAFKRKWSSMHYLSWNASKRLTFSLFEAVVWSQGDSLYPRGFDINYLNPVIFYRPVEFNQGSPDNALLGAGFSVKAGQGIMAYGQLVLDEFLLKEVRAGNGWYANKQALQLGVVAREPFGLQGWSMRAEGNVVRPFIYTHSDSRQNYAHFGQPLAHPYGSNFKELLLHVDKSSGRWIHGVRTSMAWLGRDSVYSSGNNIFRPERERRPGLVGVRDFGYRIGGWQEYTVFHLEARSGWLIDPNTGTRAEVLALYRSRSLAGSEVWTDLVVRVGIVCHFRERHPEQEPRYVLR
ncbi:MAG: hypothetical protein IPJ85_15005 [Flavobacteriales bacterium]|nr:hypothetical protein [Flavobacteriales bacterium]